MKKGWTTTKLVAIGALGVLYFLVKTIFYISTLSLSGSAFAGVIALIISPFFVILAVLIINRPGTATIFLLLSFLIQLPLPQLFPPLVNLISFLITGLLIDGLSLLLISRNKLLLSFIGGAAYNFINALEVIILYFTIGLAGTKNIPHFLVTSVGLILVVIILSVIGSLSGYAAHSVYKKISITSVVKRIQA